MKKITTLLALLLFGVYQTGLATKLTITISGFSYSPATSSAAVGDTVSIQASSFHPLVQIDQTTYNANQTTPMSGGWGTKTATYTFVITQAVDIYFCCANHGTNGMKGMIAVAGSGISNAAVSAGVSLFPNPAVNGNFTVKAGSYNGSNGSVMLYDMQGKLVETHELKGILTTVHTNQPAGTYFYKVMIGSASVERGKLLVTAEK